MQSWLEKEDCDGLTHHCPKGFEFKRLAGTSRESGQVVKESWASALARVGSGGCQYVVDWRRGHRGSTSRATPWEGSGRR